MTIRIEKADESALPRLQALIEILGFHKENGYFEQCLIEQKEGRREIFIVTVDGADAGYGMLNWHPQYTLYRRLNMPEIQDLNVIPQQRRKGAAAAVIAHCEELARGKGCEHMGISVGLYADYGPAQRLYFKLGYMPDGFGVTYDRNTVRPGEMRPVDDNLCLMLVKDL